LSSSIQEKAKYMFVSHHQNVGENCNLMTPNKSFEMWQSSNMWE